MSEPEITVEQIEEILEDVRAAHALIHGDDPAHNEARLHLGAAAERLEAILIAPSVAAEAVC